MSDQLQHLLEYYGYSPALAAVAAGLLPALLAAVLLLGLLFVNSIFFVWLERKVAGRIQDRLGPTRVGGKFGWLQTIADGVKLLFKEDLVPKSADGFLFRLAPYLTFAGVYAAFIALPFANGWVAYGSTTGALSTGILFLLAMLSTEVFGILLAGYGSGSKWALFGGMREAAQMVSYEVPMALAVLVPVIATGTMDLGRISTEQQGWFWEWFLFRDPFTFLAFWVYFICAIASCKRAPFDLAEAESELVAGFHTEYSGIRWLFFFLAEYSAMFAVSGLAVILFLGGWHLGLPVWSLGGAASDLAQVVSWPHPVWSVGNFLNAIVFIIKCYFLVFVQMWIRWSLPRLRIDQVMMTCLKYLLPIACFLLLGISLWEVFVRPLVGPYFKWSLATLVVGSFALAFLSILLSPSSQLPSGGVAASWNPTRSPSLPQPKA
ncbi:MAG: NADH-quinone oxidoreductase subunit NuoH [Gemmataceae bacterium]